MESSATLFHPATDATFPYHLGLIDQDNSPPLTRTQIILRDSLNFQRSFEKMSGVDITSNRHCKSKCLAYFWYKMGRNLAFLVNFDPEKRLLAKTYFDRAYKYYSEIPEDGFDEKDKAWKYHVEGTLLWQLTLLKTESGFFEEQTPEFLIAQAKEILNIGIVQTEPESLFVMGMMLISENQRAKAFQLIKQAHDLGHGDASALHMCQQSETSSDQEEYAFLEQAASRGSIRAIHVLVESLLFIANSTHTELDEIAEELLRVCPGFGGIKSIKNMILSCLDDAIDMNIILQLMEHHKNQLIQYVIRLYKLAEEQGCIWAIKGLADIYLGRTIPESSSLVDLAEGSKYLKLAAQLGDESAQRDCVQAAEKKLTERTFALSGHDPRELMLAKIQFSPEEAVQWLDWGIWKYGDDESKTDLLNIYMEGSERLGLLPNEWQAVQLAERLHRDRSSDEETDLTAEASDDDVDFFRVGGMEL